MLWYFLGPLRGTTQPPRLSANHPIRKAFYRHGKGTARHWLVAMLVSVAIAMAFSYPTILLSWNPTAGLAAYPPHVWTTAKTVNETQTEADIEMRQVWVHGSYMRALDKDVLKQGLGIQKSLVGDGRPSSNLPTMNHSRRVDNLQWGYHSPLMYWNNSVKVIDADKDVLNTINEQKHSSSSLNVVLRPASVFAGKKFDRTKLLAADALVITLINKAEERVGSEWDNKMLSLTQDACPGCTLFPPDGRMTRYGVYEFSFKPLSVEENLALAIAYGLMALYVLLSLRKMKAFHSRFGLVVTAITQITWSVLGSFTICGILHINLAMIPQNAYPFVVLVIGLENMFRTINAVLAYPPTMATDLRIANALSDTGPLSVATAAQNLTILSLLSTVVSPGVAAFCAFAAIATLFDVFFLLTFFVAVLNVDIRRFELQDAITARLHNQPRPIRHKRRSTSVHNTWFDALVSGRLPFSTRMAGTAVTTTFVLSLNYHFFERKEMVTSLRQLLGFAHTVLPSLADFDAFASSPMNASLTPGEWMRMQDFDTAKEVMRLAKPGEDSFIMKIFAPLVVVLSGSDRAGASFERNTWSQGLRSFAVHHFYPVAVAVVFAVAFVAVLMNFLLYNEPTEETNKLEFDSAEDVLSVQSISLLHKLDIVKIAGNESGDLLTIALDRTVSVSRLDRNTQSRSDIAVPPDVLRYIKWPVHNLAISAAGDWIACHCADDHVLLYNCVNDSIDARMVPYPDSHPALIFAFTSLPSDSDSGLHFVMLTSGGRSTVSCLENQQLIDSYISSVPLIGGTIVDTNHTERRLLAISEDARLTSHSWEAASWYHERTVNLQIPISNGRLAKPAFIDIVGDAEREILIVTLLPGTVLLDRTSLAHLTTILTRAGEVVEERTLVSTPRQCAFCGGPAFQWIARLARTGCEPARSLTTWSIDQDLDNACVCVKQRTSECRSFDSAIKAEHEVSSLGSWQALRCQKILGLRRASSEDVRNSSQIRIAGTTSALRQRRHARSTSRSETLLEQWEAYMLSASGELETIELSVESSSITGSDGEAAPLYVYEAGPTTMLDERTAAIAFGNTVKIIRASWSNSILKRPVPSLKRQSSTSRKRGTFGKAR